MPKDEIQKCKCGANMVYIFCWDNPDQDVAFNLYGCDQCGMVLKQHVWAHDGEEKLWLEGGWE